MKYYMFIVNHFGYWENTTEIKEFEDEEEVKDYLKRNYMDKEVEKEITLVKGELVKVDIDVETTVNVSLNFFGGR